MSSDEPLEQGQVGVVEDRASGHTELIVALFAVEKTPDEKARKEQLKRVPTRKLLASIKQDIRRTIRAAAPPKPKKSK
jgi:hypothetical protein